MVGDVVEVAEADYRYGRGPLRLKVTGVGGRFTDAGEVWLRLRGYPLAYQDSHAGEHTFDVRVSALPGAP
jgi:hypothetical protein